MPVGCLLIGLLVVSNVFLLLTRPSRSAGGIRPDSAILKHDYPPLAFGAVSRPQQTASKFHQSAAAGNYSYTIDDALLPVLPPRMPVKLRANADLELLEVCS